VKHIFSVVASPPVVTGLLVNDAVLILYSFSAGCVVTTPMDHWISVTRNNKRSFATKVVDDGSFARSKTIFKKWDIAIAAVFQ